MIAASAARFLVDHGSELRASKGLRHDRDDERDREPSAKAFKLVLHVPSGRTHRPVTLFNGKFNGRWSGEIGDGLSALVTLDAERRWSLTINRGRESLTFYPVTASRPWELCFWLPGGWVSPGTAEVFASAV